MKGCSIPIFSFAIPCSLSEAYVALTSGVGLLPSTTSSTTSMGRFRAVFGARSEVCVFLWDSMFPTIPTGAHKKHLLWALYFKKYYSTEHAHDLNFKYSEKTFRKWVWNVIQALSLIQTECFSFTFLISVIFQKHYYLIFLNAYSEGLSGLIYLYRRHRLPYSGAATIFYIVVFSEVSWGQMALRGRYQSLKRQHTLDEYAPSV